MLLYNKRNVIYVEIGQLLKHLSLYVFFFREFIFLIFELIYEKCKLISAYKEIEFIFLTPEGYPNIVVGTG